MKIQFNPDLDFQKDAIDAVTGVFEGQAICKTSFSVSMPTVDDAGQGYMLSGTQQSDIGIGNSLLLDDDDLLKNMQQVQLNNGLKQSASMIDGRNFNIEMETGTGKTYVYLRSIFEMNHKFGFSKFIIVVPSLAIKEGVYKSLQITEQHFKGLYNNVPFDYFIYDSGKREQVRSFATNDVIQIMVINIDAFRKSFTDPTKENKANLIHRADDRLSGMKPIEFIRSTNPILIIDEPQSVDNTPKSKEAIKTLNPLCAFRYSATHLEKYNLLFKLDAIDAYEKKLVKQIEVASLGAQDSHNCAYIRLLSVNNRKSPITAKIELDVNQSGITRRVKTIVKSGDDLFEKSGGRDLYDGYIINEIYCGDAQEYIDFTSKPEVIRLHQSIGGADDDALKRLQIKKTIEEHLEKELKLVPQGIKVLTLFFIDRVANYRSYSADGVMLSGKYAKWFEEEYRKIIAKPKYDVLIKKYDLEKEPQAAHNGYFSIDKRKKSDPENVVRFKDTKGNTKDDDSAYNLIMKDKEKLLSFGSKLRFIFSHSALREGWDNPNVFQICTLNETASVIKKRQEIGRGLRLAVNQDGERVHGFEVNTLTVMANESYTDFVKQLQQEIEEDEGIQFGVVVPHQFANIVMTEEGEERKYLGTENSLFIFEHLIRQGYLDQKGKIQDRLRIDLKNNHVNLPKEFKPVAGVINSLLKKISGGLEIKNKDDRKVVSLNKQVYLSDDFKTLWNRIKHKTVYRVKFSADELMESCAKELNENLIVGKAKFTYEKAKVIIDHSKVDAVVDTTQTYLTEGQNYQLPDIVGYLQEETKLKRSSIVSILRKCGKLDKFKDNPQKFIDESASIIKKQKQIHIVDGIKYQKIGDKPGTSDVKYFAQELFESQELMGYLNKNMIESQKSVYDHVIYDSNVEEAFAKEFEKSEDIKLYAKLPSWFRIDTPLGGYNPDWAVLVEQDGKEKLFFVVETKGSIYSPDLRPIEEAKIKCGKKHFEALDQNAQLIKAENYSRFAGQF
jgi:type III restriction enzyme